MQPSRCSTEHPNKPPTLAWVPPSSHPLSAATKREACCGCWTKIPSTRVRLKKDWSNDFSPFTNLREVRCRSSFKTGFKDIFKVLFYFRGAASRQKRFSIVHSEAPPRHQPCHLRRLRLAQILSRKSCHQKRQRCAEHFKQVVTSASNSYMRLHETESLYCMVVVICSFVGTM